MKNTIIGLACLALALGLHFYPTVVACVATGAFTDVDPNCQAAFQSQKLFDTIGLSNVEAIDAYYKTVNNQRQLKKVVNFIGLIKDMDKQPPKDDN